MHITQLVPHITRHAIVQITSLRDQKRGAGPTENIEGSLNALGEASVSMQ